MASQAVTCSSRRAVSVWSEKGIRHVAIASGVVQANRAAPVAAVMPSTPMVVSVGRSASAEMPRIIKISSLQ